MKLLALAMASTVGLLCGCGKPAGSGDAPPPVAPMTQAAPVPVPEPAAAEAPTAPVTSPPAAGGAVPAAGAAPADELTNYRVDADGKTLSDLQIIQNAVDGYNRNRLNLLEPDSKPGPELQDVSDLVKIRYLPRIPPPPAGKKWALDEKKAKVLLVNQ